MRERGQEEEEREREEKQRKRDVLIDRTGEREEERRGHLLSRLRLRVYKINAC